MTDPTPTDAAEPAEPAESVEPAEPAEPPTAASLERRLHLLVGTLAVLLVGSFVVIGVLFARVADAEQDAAAAREAVGTGGASSSEIDELRAELERVEAGAALYASQVDGFLEQLVELEPEVSAGIDEAIAGLREFGTSTIAFDVEIDEVIPVDTEVVIRRTVEVPIRTEIPITEDIDTTITIDTPLGGIPVDVNVPVDVVVPIDIVVDIPIDETVPISDEFPVQLDVPIAIEVGDTELANLTESLAAGLESLRDVLSGLG